MRERPVLLICAHISPSLVWIRQATPKVVRTKCLCTEVTRTKSRSLTTVDQPQCTKSSGDFSHCYSAVRRAYKVCLLDVYQELCPRLPVLNRDRVHVRIAKCLLVYVLFVHPVTTPHSSEVKASESWLQSYFPNESHHRANLLLRCLLFRRLHPNSAATNLFTLPSSQTITSE